jgi:hypothetical protein
MRFLLLALVMAVCGLSALAEDDYYPLHDGNEWVYATTRGDALVGDSHVMIKGTVERDGKIYFQTKNWMTPDPSKVNLGVLLRKDDKAIYFNTLDGKSPAEQMEFVLPLKVGATWRITVGDNTETSTVVGMEPYDIAGRIYENCYHIRSVSDHGGIVDEIWMAPNVGIVKSITKYPHHDPETITLKEFKPGK